MPDLKQKAEYGTKSVSPLLSWALRQHPRVRESQKPVLWSTFSLGPLGTRHRGMEEQVRFGLCRSECLGTRAARGEKVFMSVLGAAILDEDLPIRYY